MCKKNIYVLTIIFLHEIDKGGLISVNYFFWLYFQKNVPNRYRENILFTWILDSGFANFVETEKLSEIKPLLGCQL